MCNLLCSTNWETPKQIDPFLLIFKKKFPQYEPHRKCCESFFSSTEYEDQALMITVHKDLKECVSPQSLLSTFFQAKTPFTEVKNPLHDSSASLKDDMEIQAASSSAPITALQESKTPKKICAPHSSKSAKSKIKIKLILHF